MNVSLSLSLARQTARFGEEQRRVEVNFLGPITSVRNRNGVCPLNQRRWSTQHTNSAWDVERVSSIGRHTATHTNAAALFGCLATLQIRNQIVWPRRHNLYAHSSHLTKSYHIIYNNNFQQLFVLVVVVTNNFNLLREFEKLFLWYLLDIIWLAARVLHMCVVCMCVCV